MRVKNSFGQSFINEGTTKVFSQEKYQIDYTRKFYLFDVIPVGAVRMTKRDRIFTNPNHEDPLKRQRKSVTMYFAFKNQAVECAKQLGYVLGESLDAVFLTPMPDSWSEKKKDKMNGLPCKTKPDADNMAKAWMDSLKKEDSDIWVIHAEKRWATNGSILVYDTR